MINKLADLKKLKSREKLLLIALAGAVGFGIYFQIIYKPLSRNINRYKFQIQKSKSRLRELKEKFPQIEQQRKNIHSLNVKCDDLLKQIDEMEKGLPGKEHLSQLLDKIVSQAKDLNLSSVRQKVEAGEEYSRTFIELKFYAPYKDVVNYIGSIESISPFLIIEGLEVSEPKAEKKERGVLNYLMLSSLLGEISTLEQLKIEEEKEALEVSRDIFVSKAKPIYKLKKAEWKLEGITYNRQSPTAIINGEVVRVGSQVDTFTVKEIHPEKVILTDGLEEHLLTIAR